MFRSPVWKTFVHFRKKKKNPKQNLLHSSAQFREVRGNPSPTMRAVLEINIEMNQEWLCENTGNGKTVDVQAQKQNPHRAA